MQCCVHVAVAHPLRESPHGPEFVIPSLSLSVRDGSGARFECRVRGDPAPERVAWYHDARLLKPGSAEFAQTYDAASGMCVLDIVEVYPEDAGKYTAVAKNPYGAATCTATLTVQPGNKAAAASCTSAVYHVSAPHPTTATTHQGYEAATVFY